MIDPSAAPTPQGGPMPMGMPDIQAAPMPLGGPPLPVQGPDPDVVTIDQVMALLRNDALRGFAIEVQTDSLVEADQQAEKQQAMEFVQAVGEYVAKTGPIVQAMPPLAEMFGEMLLFAARRFKVGQQMEETIERSMHKAGLLLTNPKPPQPSPDEMVKLEGIKAKTAAEIQKAQIDGQVSQMTAQAKMQEVQATAQNGAMQAQADQQREAEKHQLEMMRMDRQAQHDERKHQMEIEKHHMTMQQADMSHQQAMEQKKADAEQRKADAKKKDAN